MAMVGQKERANNAGLASIFGFWQNEHFDQLPAHWSGYLSSHYITENYCKIILQLLVVDGSGTLVLINWRLGNMIWTLWIFENNSTQVCRILAMRMMWIVWKLHRVLNKDEKVLLERSCKKDWKNWATARSSSTIKKMPMTLLPKIS